MTGLEVPMIFPALLLLNYYGTASSNVELLAYLITVASEITVLEVDADYSFAFFRTIGNHFVLIVVVIVEMPLQLVLPTRDYVVGFHLSLEIPIVPFDAFIHLISSFLD